MRILLAAVLLALSACGNPNQSSCLPAPSPPPGDCPANIYADATTRDPLCLDANNQNICRGEASDCLVCTGGDFPDGCLIRAMTTHQCVHACSLC